MPSPRSVDGGLVVVSVTLTGPTADAVKVCITVPPGASVDVNVSVPGAGAGAVGVVEVLSLPQAAAVSARAPTITRPSDRLMRLLRGPLCGQDVSLLKDSRLKRMRPTTAALGAVPDVLPT